MTDIITKILFMIFVPFIVVVTIIPYIKKIANDIHAVDNHIGGRHVHKVPIPKLGGLAIFFGFLVGYMFFGIHSVTMNAILIGSFIILIVGVIDDITELSATTQLIAQIIAACVIVFYGNLLIENVSAFDLYIEFSYLSYPLTIIFIVGCINCINFIDGLDGLSGGISCIYYLTVGIIAAYQGKFGLDFVISFIMLGSVLGFLVYNFNPASIFAGNSGSMFMGFIISVIALLGFKNVTMTSLFMPILIVAIPFLDTIFAILRRTIKKESPFKADRYHIHHQLLNRNLSQKTAVIIIYIIDSLFAFATLVYVLKDNTLGYIIYGILSIIVIIFVAKTNIVFDDEFKEKFKIRKK